MSPRPTSPLRDRPDRLNLKAQIERIFARYNSRDLDPIDDVVHPDYVEHTPWGDIQGDTAIKEFVRTCLLGPFPDAWFEVSNVLIDGDLAAWRVHFTGTNTVGIAPACLEALPDHQAALAQRSLMGLPPTGSEVDLVRLHLGRLSDDDRLIEHWAAYEQLTIIQHLGLKELFGARRRHDA